PSSFILHPCIMKLLLVRHGQTDWNIARRFQGQSDIPLNEVGKKQAKALANRLSAEHFDSIYSSDLQRATETAKIICKSEWHSDLRLREVNFGDWEGLTYGEIKEKHPDTLSAWENDIYKNAPPNGETLEGLSARVQSMLGELYAKHKDQTVLIVAHGGVLQTLICLALNLKPTMYWRFHLSTASLSEIAFYPKGAGAIVNLLNDTSHLEKIIWDK
ncbi:MAG: alpha-ribazole phosphatase, partial [Anaerolineales bacterium]|nr:alpha-ribazole phosphatase [Anaerolineales bacterium]